MTKHYIRQRNQLYAPVSVIRTVVGGQDAFVHVCGNHRITVFILNFLGIWMKPVGNVRFCKYCNKRLPVLRECLEQRSISRVV